VIAGGRRGRRGGDRQLALSDKVHPDYDAGVRAALKGRSSPQQAAE
jgi:hypothetical protein